MGACGGIGASEKSLVVVGVECATVDKIEGQYME